jgi:hypothetical protein
MSTLFNPASFFIVIPDFNASSFTLKREDPALEKLNFNK